MHSENKIDAKLNPDLRLLLGHLPCCLDLPDLGRAGDGLAIRTQGPRGLEIDL